MIVYYIYRNFLLGFNKTDLKKNNFQTQFMVSLISLIQQEMMQNYIKDIKSEVTLLGNGKYIEPICYILARGKKISSAGYRVNSK